MKRKIAVIIGILIAIATIQATIAFEFDNVKSYDTESRTITIKDSLLGIRTTVVGWYMVSPIANTIDDGTLLAIFWIGLIINWVLAVIIAPATMIIRAKQAI